MMQETLLTGTARKAELPGWQAAGKTGTSQDWRDAWFVGYTSYLVAGVWLGNDDDSPTKKVSGGNLPVEIWSRFMKAAHEGRAGRRPAARRLAQRRCAQPGRAAAAAARPHWRAGSDAAAGRTGRRRAPGSAPMPRRRLRRSSAVAAVPAPAHGPRPSRPLRSPTPAARDWGPLDKLSRRDGASRSVRSA